MTWKIDVTKLTSIQKGSAERYPAFLKVLEAFAKVNVSVKC